MVEWCLDVRDGRRGLGLEAEPGEWIRPWTCQGEWGPKRRADGLYELGDDGIGMMPSGAPCREAAHDGADDDKICNEA